jgi:high-affinity nickel permease
VVGPPLFGTALLAYIFGLRHAVDAHHIAAIDNVVRQLMQDGQRPLPVGFFLSVGHSTVVVLAIAAIGLGAATLRISSTPSRLRHYDRNLRLRAFPTGDCIRKLRPPAKRSVAL